MEYQTLFYSFLVTFCTQDNIYVHAYTYVHTYIHIGNYIYVRTSRLTVVSHEAKKKQHACAFSGPRDHYSELFTRMAALKFLNAVYSI